MLSMIYDWFSEWTPLLCFDYYLIRNNFIDVGNLHKKGKKTPIRSSYNKSLQLEKKEKYNYKIKKEVTISTKILLLLGK